MKEVLQAYYRATQFDQDWYKAWHAWALANTEVVNQIDSQNNGSLNDVNGRELSSHIISAIQGFFQSISLRNKQVLQDTLRLLTLWFKYGDHDEVSHAMSTGFASVGIVTWLEVVPQVSGIHRYLSHYANSVRLSLASKLQVPTSSVISTSSLLTLGGNIHKLLYIL